ncbi:helix-turn-helix transcriptional regulator [Streptomyces sp. H10-C2]|uniref:helix-turn-helix domain-containing protein n=1 Tax=unclassified Streptomyces TaxID=2593676 RepID=UPI0024BA57BC|nr:MULTISPECIES: helix-turn-helix transcriptional regulator [unclassified Streptomyces]MDJ0342413.1 helix-turn-helix transcriptional regulator [Streptomyces sp. PH10-H1]MDJ0372268.1 helix-turn-helix transcriptional regulator [Streptomyces sp. H10-C2]
MPPRTNPTARQERLGVELRRMREQASMTAREAAALLAINPIQISQIESGRGGISEERLRRLAGFYECDDPALVDALVEMASERGKGWWDEYRGVLPQAFHDLAELEDRATHLRTLQIVHIPGMMQTPDYARAVFTYVKPDMSPEEIETRVEHRTRRRAIFEKEEPPEFVAIIHEAALRIMVGSRKSAHATLLDLIDLSERERVTLRVIPFSVEGFAGAGYSMMYANGRVPQLDTVVIDGAHYSRLLSTEAQLRKHRAVLDRVQDSTLPRTESRDLIQRIAREL